MIYRLVTFFLTFFIASPIIAQQSFVKEIPLFSPPNEANRNISIDKNTQAISIFGKPEEKLPLFLLSPEAMPIKGINLFSPIIEKFTLGRVFQRENNYHMINAYINHINNEYTCSIIVVDNQNNQVWAKAVSNFLSLRPSTINNNHIIGVNAINSSFVPSIYKLDITNGNPIWSYKYLPFYQGDYIDITKGNLKSTPSEHTIILGSSNHPNGPHILITIFKINKEGQLEQLKAINSASYNFTYITFSNIAVDSQGNIYIPVFSIPNNESLLHQAGTILKFDPDLNLLWAKRLDATSFNPARRVNLSVAPDDGIFFSYSTYGTFPVLTGKISPQGDLEWTKGYAFTGTAMEMGNDGSIFFADDKKYNPDGSFESGIVIAKTTPDGEIESCPQFDACLELIDIEVTTEDLTWTQEPAPFPVDIPIEMEEFDFTVEDFCGTPTPPSAEFTLPDTICQAECVFPTDLKNNLAHEVRWNILGPSFDTTIVDSVFTWCFEEAGEYLIEQEVWLLGCAEIMPHQLTVLSDDLALPLGEDISICMQGQTTHTLTAESSRPLVDFEWSTGATTASIDITTTGTYGLIASDGYCDVEDVINVNFALEDIAPPYIEIPNDTLLCPDLLPLSFIPTSVYTDSFYINQQLVDNIALSQTGTTTVSAFVNGCEVEKDIHLQVESCTVPIFIPNAFSPNDDGINDVVAPLGEDFDPISLHVYDRWGGLIFQTNHAPFHWNGRTLNKPAPVGVYLIVFSYWNKRNLTEEVISQDVSLLP